MPRPTKLRGKRIPKEWVHCPNHQNMWTMRLKCRKQQVWVTSLHLLLFIRIIPRSRMAEIHSIPCQWPTFKRTRTFHPHWQTVLVWTRINEGKSKIRKNGWRKILSNNGQVKVVVFTVAKLILRWLKKFKPETISNRLHLGETGVKLGPSIVGVDQWMRSMTLAQNPDQAWHLEFSRQNLARSQFCQSHAKSQLRLMNLKKMAKTHLWIIRNLRTLQGNHYLIMIPTIYKIKTLRKKFEHSNTVSSK